MFPLHKLFVKESLPKPEATDFRHSVIGPVFVYMPPETPGPIQPHHYARLPYGTKVNILERFKQRGAAPRLRIVDEQGRTGVCNADDIWEHLC